MFVRRFLPRGVYFFCFLDWTGDGLWMKILKKINNNVALA